LIIGLIEVVLEEMLVCHYFQKWEVIGFLKGSQFLEDLCPNITELELDCF